MKKMLSIWIAGVLLLSACGKSEPKDKAPEKPFIAMTIDGKYWKSDSMFKQPYITDKRIGFEGDLTGYEDGIGYPISFIYLYLLQKTTAKQTLKATGNNLIAVVDSLRNHSDQVPVYAGLGTFQQHGHFSCESFDVDDNDSLNNWIQITKEEDNYKKIWGKFQLTLFRMSINHGCPHPYYSDSFRIREGSFYMEFD